MRNRSHPFGAIARPTSPLSAGQSHMTCARAFASEGAAYRRHLPQRGEVDDATPDLIRGSGVGWGDFLAETLEPLRIRKHQRPPTRSAYALRASADRPPHVGGGGIWVLRISE